MMLYSQINRILIIRCKYICFSSKEQLAKMSSSVV
ncbi:hypothetical protein E2C01_055278 [Portunus trituberculatus]|uniref:Uncharacterized protein n=1 Tax=Portunus trituberculatus TaxID=210409 RepID=A0A5B7GQR8_PORTR|nr:hypothetical protein [Portunus trituberculatus]